VLRQPSAVLYHSCHCRLVKVHKPFIFAVGADEPGILHAVILTAAHIYVKVGLDLEKLSKILIIGIKGLIHI